MGDASSALTVQFPASPQRPRRRGGRHLKAVPTPRRRRSTAIPVLVGAAVVFIGMFAIAAMHALLIDGQIELDALEREISAETESVERLRLEVAELEAPDRILEVARDRLGMVESPEIGYVLPGGDGTELLRVGAATAPPPPTTAPPVVVETPTAETDGPATIDDAVAAALASAGVTPTQPTAETQPTTETQATTETDATPQTGTADSAPPTTGAAE